MKLHISFKKKMILVIAVVTVALGVLATFSVFWLNRQTISDLAVKYLDSITVQQAGVIKDTFNASMAIAKLVASQPLVIEYVRQKDPELQDADILRFFSALDPDKKYQSIYLMDRTGRTLTSTDPAFVDQNYRFRDYFTKAFAGMPTIDAAIGATTGKFGYFFAHPIYQGNGDVIGVAVVKLRDATLTTLLKPSILSDDGTALLVDEYGIIMQSTDPAMTFKSLGALTQEEIRHIEQTKKFGNVTIIPLQYEPLKQAIGTPEASKAVIAYDEAKKRDDIVGIAKIGRSPFSLVIKEPLQRFAGAAERVAGITGIFTALMAIAAGLVLFLWIARLLRPLTILKEKAAQLGKGKNLDQTIRIDTGDEFEELGVAFNAMIQRLRGMYEDQERTIWERTADFEKFKLAVEAASDPVIITDIDGRVLYANKASERITGYSREEIVDSKPSLWGRQMPIGFYENLWNTIKRDKKEFYGEVTNRRKNGERYVAELYISPLLMNKDMLYGFVGIERDITARKAADKAKTEFVSIASHQLRTPLAIINWYIEMLLKEDVGAVNKEQKTYLEQIRAASQRMVDLVNSLLSVSRIDIGTLDVKPETLTLSAAADSILADMNPQIRQKKLRIAKEYDPSVPSIDSDPNLLRVIFSNLLSNAVTYTPEGGLITVAIRKSDAKNALITVTDTGYGIPTGQQSRIFEKFFRADNAREKEPNGNGLGLYITKSLVDRLGGRIWFSSVENKGTAFYVSLPFTRMPARQSEPAKQTNE